LFGYHYIEEKFRKLELLKLPVYKKKDFSKLQLHAIISANPGITTEEILKYISYYKMPGNWYPMKISRLIKEMTYINKIIKYNKNKNAWEFLYYIDN